MKKKLHKSNKDVKICGVCGGIAEYFDIDATLVRLIWIIFIFCCGAGLLAYIVAALVMTNAENVEVEVISHKKVKRLYKSEKDKKICGVCGGIGEYFNIDPTIIRLIWAVSILCCGTGLLAYFIAAIVLPKK